MCNLAQALALRGVLDESERILREALQLKRRVFGAMHALTLNTEADLALVEDMRRK
jgi:hypothetical protein